MKPGFALSLSFEGIALLHRVAGEWQLIGEVAPDAPDLDAALADLRERALALEPDGPHCKIIIPDEQVRYLSVETGTVDLETRDQLVRAALEGATPYAVADLRYDISVQGSLAHVAAVARETLVEARKFALTHGYVPVSFAASPKDKAFAGEAFFGDADPAADRIGTDEDASVIRAENTPEAPTAPAQPDSEAASQPARAGFTTRRDKGGNAPADSDDDAADPADTPKAPIAPLAVDPVPPTRAVTAVGLDKDEAPVAGLSGRQSPDPAPRASFPEDIAQPALAKALDYPAPDSAGAPITTGAPEDETARMTVFGARQSLDAGHRRRFPVVPIGVGAVLLLAAMAVWAMFFASDGTPTPGVALKSAPPEAVQTVDPVTSDKLTDTDAAALDALRGGPDDSATTGNLQPETPFAPPQEPDTPAIIGLGDLYIASIDRTDVTRNATDLPASDAPRTDTLPGTGTPSAADATATLDPNALVVPTPEGALNPNGVLVYLGRPPVVPPAVPTRFETPPHTDTADAQLAAMRPRLRPENLAPPTEPSKPDVTVNAETGGKSPPMRPESLAAQVDRLIEEQLRDLESERAEPDDATATARAILRSPKPSARPGNFANIAKKAETTPSPQQTAAVAAPVKVVPKIPSSASVAQQATRSKAINLRQINLIGVYGPPANRRALVRLSNGRYKKVKIGDTVDGGRVVAIGENNVHYQKGGRGITLSMPSG